MDQLFSMQVFCQIIDSGSMALAARTLGVAPATVTGILARVEKKLGVRLLDRTTRRISMTEAGRIWYEHAKRILEESAEAETAVRNLAVEPRGVLRVTLPLGVAMTFVYPNMHAFALSYPHIELDLQINDRVIDLIENRLDLALRVGYLKDSDLVARPLLKYQRVVCASPQYLSEHGVPEHPSDLSQHHCLLYGHDQQPVYWNFEVDGIVKTIPVQGKLRSNESNALLTWARCGHGLTRQPAWLVTQDLHQGSLLSVLDHFTLKDQRQLPGIYAVMPKARSYPAKVKAFLDFFSQKISMPFSEKNSV